MMDKTSFMGIQGAQGHSLTNWILQISKGNFLNQQMEVWIQQGWHSSSNC